MRQTSLMKSYSSMTVSISLRLVRQHRQAWVFLWWGRVWQGCTSVAAAMAAPQCTGRYPQLPGKQHPGKPGQSWRTDTSRDTECGYGLRCTETPLCNVSRHGVWTRTALHRNTVMYWDTECGHGLPKHCVIYCGSLSFLLIYDQIDDYICCWCW